MTKDEVLDGLKAGRTLAIYRRDNPLLPWLMSDARFELRLVQIEEQSSRIEVRMVRDAQKSTDGAASGGGEPAEAGTP